MRTGRISLLIDSPLRDLLIALRAVPAEARKHVTAHTRANAEPIWQEETRDRAGTRLQQRALVNTARVGVAIRNIYLRSGGVGKMSSGAAVSTVAFGAEFGANPDKQITQRSRKGTPYKRRLGNVFGAPRRGGNVVYPAAREATPRIGSVAIQSAYRALLDAFDGKK
ncbi:hypothetical protein [Microbacterium sp. Ag1]|uniref:hypothetical protein n=1 Tax=Microbacterium sp. Ag1 TaxID=1643443 RepID=UPI0006291E83|nr:hypothetical protein [Microbacterium sp. Ag1]KKX96691.1 hypothetical protein AAY78_15340 [Microbacterium sp. Ag1]